ncbi:MAG TPA: acetolactate synthase large subunit, partial [Ectothiorhodospiraceae bacterium]|nr:acetolactate synthase large subunit [Ectothiorhodospiraceae bacterium]
MKVSDLFIKALEAEGVEYIFGIPGEENLDFLNSLKGSSIKFILTRHEQAAGFMAATYGRLTGKTGVCLSTLGPGATNLVTAAAYAQLGAMPMLMITGQKPIKAGRQGAFQIINVVDMMRPLTKYTRQITSAHNTPARIREAFRRAEEERPGAVHLELPEDIARDETDAPVIQRSNYINPRASELSIYMTIAMIEAAKYPLILIGAAANRRYTFDALNDFIVKTGIPFFSTQMGKGVVDEYDPLFIGNATLSGDDYLHRAIESSDLIINVGHDVVEKPPFIMGDDYDDRCYSNFNGTGYCGNAKVIHINYTSAIIDAIYHPQQSLIGDIADSLECLTKEITVQKQWNFSRFMAVKIHLEEHLRDGVDDESFPVVPQRLVADIRKVMPYDGIIALDNGVY